MKKNFTILIFGFCLLAKAQDKITFAYDTAGNQITRSLCINCQTSKPAKEIVDADLLSKEDLLKFSAEDSFSYYPNPVREQLYLSWQQSDENSAVITSLQIVNINGQVLETIPAGNLKVNNKNVSFSLYPSGIYILSVNYKDGNQKTIKVIKQ